MSAHFMNEIRHHLDNREGLELRFEQLDYARDLGVALFDDAYENAFGMKVSNYMFIKHRIGRKLARKIVRQFQHQMNFKSYPKKKENRL